MFKILIVEDEELIRKGLVYLPPWEQLGCSVAGEASDGAEGLEMIDMVHPDIVICDIRMPVMDGLQMLEASMGKYDFNAILLSGYSDFEYAKKAIHLGVNDYLLKPVDFEELSAAIRKLTSIRKTHVQQALHLKQAQALLRKEALLPAADPEILFSDSYSSRLLQIIFQQFNQRITLSEIGHNLGISPSYLNGKFKAATGCTFNTYLNRYRIAKAIEYLSVEHLKVRDAAEKAGFYDYKYFVKVFKKYVGCTPSQFVEELDRSAP